MYYRRTIRAALLATVAASAALPMAAHAQSDTTPEATVPQAAAEAEVQDIVVTARRRNETSLTTPVAISAIGGAELDRRGINNIDSLARAVPTLLTSEATGSAQGGVVAIRGLSGVDGNPFGDQAVSFNIDGVQVARSSVRRLSQMDIAQIEVLKGPQALFFGKNSPAGIISVRTGDPTSTFQGQLSSGYEFKADETRNEGFISGPITPTLGFRVAAYYDHMKGYVKNVAPETGTGVFAPFDRRTPNGTEYALRGTLKWEPSDRFDARLKLSYTDLDTSSPTDSIEYVNCPLGTPQNSFAPEDCRANGRNTVTDNIGPNFGAFNPRFKQETYLKSKQTLGGLEMNYKLSDDFTLSSITGYYKNKTGYLGNFTATFAETGAIPRTFLPSVNDLSIRETSQELRLTSDLSGPVNFLLGGFYQDSRASQAAAVLRNALAPVFSANYLYAQKGTAYSLFAQSQIKLLPTLELSVGGRYSHEEKKLPVFRAATAGSPNNLIEVNSRRQISFNNLSPEATLSFRPNPRLTIFGSYKEGFLSGGFNATQPVLAGGLGADGRYNSAIDPSYDQQLIKGFEGGIKTSLLDGDLRLNLIAYTYETTGLQVAVLVGLQQVLSNAGAVRTKGLEFDFSYRTPVEGLSLTGALSYEKGRYTDYQGTCYRGLAAPACVNQVNRFTNQVGLLHDLSGAQLARAPDWSGNAGFDYTSPAFSGIKIGVNGNMSFSSGFFTDVINSPGGRQKAYELYDAGVRVMDEDQMWELALIGRNLSNTRYFTRSAENPLSGAAPGGTGTLLADQTAVLSRGREVMLKATIRFGQ
jgi:iron complex outermembrane recepter protein